MASRPPLRIYLLGNFRVENDMGVVKLATKPTAALLAYLVLHRHAAHERAHLAMLFWGSEAAHENRRRATAASLDKLAGASFRKALSNLRKQLGADLILDSDDGKTIRLNPDASLWVDAEKFKDEISGSGFILHPSSLILYSGDLLSEFQDDPDFPWLDARRAEYRERFIQGCLQLAQDARARGEWALVIEHATRAQERDAYNETAAQHLIVAYARQGETERALKIYAELERVLIQDVGTAPSTSTRALRRHIERNAARSTTAELSNLPTPLTPFLGRETELEKIRAALQRARLVSLVGAGGVGKTRLAIHAAREMIPKFREGIWWVRLEELDKDTGSVAQSISQVLTVRGDAERAVIDLLCEQLRDSEMLLVLDNCEHLLADCARVCEQILTACPRIKILATSRQRLHVAGEVDLQVPPLPLPTLPASGQARAQIAALEASEAVKFFLHYARHARGDFALRAANASAVAQICRRLDGIPLALELAAARVKTLSAEYIAEHLDERFQLLAASHHTIARHQTLRAVLDWSYDLLDAAEQRVFAVLSVFAARFTLEAAEYICNGDGSNARDILEGLADKSLVLVEFDANDAPRFRLLETIREYAREKLAASPEKLAATNERLSQFYLQFSQQHAKNYLAIEDEWHNISTGMSIAHERQDWQPLLGYGQSVTDALFARGLYTDARRIIPWVILAADREEEQERSLEAMFNWGRSYIKQSLYEDARIIMERLLELGRMARDPKGIGLALYGLGWLEKELSNHTTARGHLTEGLQIYQTLQDPRGTAEILIELSLVEFREVNYALATQYAQQALQLLDADDVQVIYALQSLALIARDEGAASLAMSYCRQAVAACERQQEKGELANTWYILGQIAEDQKSWQTARQYYETSCAVYEELGEQNAVAYIKDALCGLLTEIGEFDEAEQNGRAALATLRELRNQIGTIAASRRLGIAWAKMDRISEACQLWQEALEHAKTLQDFRVPFLEALLKEYCESK